MSSHITYSSEIEYTESADASLTNRQLPYEDTRLENHLL
uniref:Uncharacterized protein n=1 Tax=Anguilla anguilla TaxID=7936 RepID=A0A0E9R921_ANGAN